MIHCKPEASLLERVPRNVQCSCLPVSVWPGGGRLDLLLLVLAGNATVVPGSGGPVAPAPVPVRNAI